MPRRRPRGNRSGHGRRGRRWCHRSAERREPGGIGRRGSPLVFLSDLLRDLATQNLDGARRFNADTHATTVAGYDDDTDTAVDDDRVAFATSKN